MRVCIDCLDRESLQIICCTIIRFEIFTKTKIEVTSNPDKADVYIASTGSRLLKDKNDEEGCLIVFPACDRWQATKKLKEECFDSVQDGANYNRFVCFFEWPDFSVAALGHSLEQIKQIMNV